MSVQWLPPAGPYVDAQLYPADDLNTRQQDFQTLMQAFGLFGGAGARYVSPNMVYPTAGAACQWLWQTRGYFNYTAGVNRTDYPGLAITYVPFTNPFPAGGGVAFIRAKARYAYGGSSNLTYGVNIQVAILDDSIALNQFGVVTYDVNAQTVITSGSYSLSYMAIGWVPLL